MTRARFAAALGGALLLGWGVRAEEPVYTTERLPYLAPGKELRTGDEAEEKGHNKLVQTFDLKAPGVYYLYLKVSNDNDTPAVISYMLDGVERPKGARRQFYVYPNTKPHWLFWSRNPRFRTQVYAARPGKHTLTLRTEGKKVTIHKVALTLFYSAVPAGETLDHSNDPGMGRAVFPLGDLTTDGRQTNRPSPPVKAKRRFHVDAGKGNDSASGATPAAAWKTFRNINGRKFSPGDAILLKRGGAWEEGLAPGGNGTPSAPITIGAYGEGPAPRINGISREAVLLRSQSNWTVQDLDLTTDAEYERNALAVVTGKGVPQPKNIRVHNVEAWDSGQSGILVGSDHGGGNGYDGVLIDNCVSYFNDGDGIAVGGSDQNGGRNSVVRYCTAYGNAGMAGIWIQSAQNGLIERCVAHDNACINIWAWNAINITIRHCEAYRGRPPRDAGGFDIDWGCEGVTIEYCYSHHNEGVGFLLMGHGFQKYRGFPTQSYHNIMRYCVSEGDSPGIGLTETFRHGKVYSNTVVAMGKKRQALGCGGWPSEPWEKDGGWSGGWPSDTVFFNNILVAMDGAIPMWTDDFATRQNNVFDYNLYFRVRSGEPLVKWAGRQNGAGFWKGTNEGQIPPDCYNDLAKFSKATGQEVHGLAADPLLAGLGNGGYGRLPLANYRLRPGSPAAGAGRPVPIDKEWLAGRAKYIAETGAGAWGIPMAPEEAWLDYWGTALGSQGGIGIGACNR